MRTFVRLGIGLLAMGAAAPALAATSFSTTGLSVIQTGGPNNYTFLNPVWTGGGVVSGAFTAVDLDGNGQISSFAGEVSGFSFSYSGGSAVNAFSLAIGSLSGLVYDLPPGIGGFLGDGTTLAIEGMRASDGVYTFALGPGPFALCANGNICGRIDGPTAGAVPEPSTWAMLLLGFGAIGATLRRRALRFARP